MLAAVACCGASDVVEKDVGPFLAQSSFKTVTSLCAFINI
jgi:hypothetical protein